jgi:DNA-binding MarR family transcriptional regulator
MSNARATPPKPKPDTANLLLDALAQLAFVLQGTLEGVAGEFELSLVQLRLLGILRDREPGMLELSKFLNLDKSSITGLVSRAEKRELVRRKPAPADGRVVKVTLTEHGRNVISRVEQRAYAELNTLIEPLPKAERRHLRELLVRVLEQDTRRRLGEAGT